MKKICNELNSIKLNERIENICVCLDEIIENGFYYIPDYVSFACTKYNLSKYELSGKINRDLKYLKKYDFELYNEYMLKLEKNRAFVYDSYKSKIDEFISDVQFKDIIDYYLTFNMSISVFTRLCKGFIDSSTDISYKKFFRKYIEMDNNNLTDEAMYSINYSINGVQISDDDKKFIIDFMKEHNIPNVYICVAIKKYINGGLGSYSKCKGASI